MRKSFILFNGLSQEATFDDEPWYLYKIKNIDNFMALFGIQFIQIKPLMTHDAHMIFRDKLQMSNSVKKLKRIRIKNKALFFLELDEKNLKLFFRLNIYETVSSHANITDGKRSVNFHKQMKTIVKRTGKHCQESTAMHNMGNKLSKKKLKGKFNYHLFNLLYPEIF